MKITIEGTPKEIAELAAILQARQISRPAKTSPLVDDENQKCCKEIADMLTALNAKAAQNAQGETAPQGEVAEHQNDEMISQEEARKIVKSMDDVGKETLKFLCHTP